MSGRWLEYVREHAGPDNNSKIASKIGIAGSQVTRWGQKSGPSVEAVRAFAIAYGRPVLEAFVAAGLLSRDDIREQVQILDLDSLSNEALANAVLARMNQGSSGAEAQEPRTKAQRQEHGGESDDPGAPIAAQRADRLYTESLAEHAATDQPANPDTRSADPA